MCIIASLCVVVFSRTRPADCGNGKSLCMTCYVWCKNEECRIPTFRCLLCRENCYSGEKAEGEFDSAFRMLVDSGKYKERFVMKRKENVVSKDQLTLWQKETAEQPPVGGDEIEEPAQTVFFFEDGKLKPFLKENYTTTALYQLMESFSVESKLVRPEDPGNLVFEGKKPSKKTIPIVITNSGESTLLESWESLESDPQLLSDAAEVAGVMPVKQVFVLRRKDS